MRPANMHRVNIKDPLEVAYWCTRLNCTERHLRMAVKAEGVMLGAVKKALAEFKRISDGDL